MRKRVAHYVRVSSEEQMRHGFSVDNQICALQKYSKEHNHVVVGVYNDAGISARKKYTRRPALLKLIEDCKAGRVDLILFTKLDRWFRSVADYYEVQSILDDCKVPWRAIWEDYETETSSGVFKVNIMLSVAQAESDRTSERIKAVNEYRRARGDFVGGSAPMGYLINGPKLIIDPEKQVGIRAVFDTFLTTFNPTATVNTGRAHGLSIDIQSVRKLLLHPVYAGEYKGHRCEPYITREQHQKIVEVYSSRSRRPKAQFRVYLFAGLLVCNECSGLLNGRATPYRTAAGSTNDYKYYRCRRHVLKRGCPGSSYSELRLERFLLSHLEIELSNLRIARVEINGKEEIEKKISTLKARLVRVGDRYEDGDLTREEYRTKRDAIKAEIDRLEQKSGESRPLPELPSDWKEIYNGLDDAHKKAFWRKILKKVIIFHDKGRKPEIIF